MLIQPILNIAEICSQKNLRHIILSPGSRVAHLTIAFARHSDIQTYTLSDERSAAFTALGMAIRLLNDFEKKSSSSLALVGIACTSGSAVYNYAPAVVEAFYQQIPLLVFTADRPPEWIDQQDGQTIRQRNIFGHHIKQSFELPADYSHTDSIWMSERIINEAINLAQTFPYGPVHINVPIREPFYPTLEETVSYDKRSRNIQMVDNQKILSKESWDVLWEIWQKTEKKMIVAGQSPYQPHLLKNLRLLSEEYQIPVIGDIIANLSDFPHLIQHQDILLNSKDEWLQFALKPELLITFGNSVLSKKLKLFLRQNPPKFHWHIQPAGQVADTFQSLTHILSVTPAYFFAKLYEDLDFLHLLENPDDMEENEFYATWQKENQKAKKHLHTFFSPQTTSAHWCELSIVGKILENLPPESLLHLSNSMPVRYANYWGLQTKRQIEVYANRGTSGIDGVLSTAVGCAMASPDRIVNLLIGDLAFFYDRNGLWNNELPSNLRIFLLNNQGGNIFRIIEGSAHQPELETYFETYQKQNAQKTAEDFGLDYKDIHHWQDLEDFLKQFDWFQQKSILIEIFTDKVQNATLLKELVQSYGS